MAGAVFGEVGGRLLLLRAPHLVNSISCVKRTNHESHFLWQAQYLVKLEGDSCCPRIGNDVSYVTRINHESLFRGRHGIW